jgi:hypothetical protein
MIFSLALMVNDGEYYSKYSVLSANLVTSQKAVADISIGYENKVESAADIVCSQLTNCTHV